MGIELKPDDCPICCGTGEYPIFDNDGELRYHIQCPECHGLGKMEDAQKEGAGEDRQN